MQLSKHPCRTPERIRKQVTPSTVHCVSIKGLDHQHAVLRDTTAPEQFKEFFSWDGIVRLLKVDEGKEHGDVVCPAHADEFVAPKFDQP